ncbi:MAG: hypothetical protein ACO1QS_19335 [Verrucomicrobiota bacterium]
MIQLRSDCLVFKLANGDSIPCSVEQVTVELIGDAADNLDPDLIRHAAAAVLHYFKHEQGREYVSLNEFSEALEHVLQSFGLEVNHEPEKAAANTNTNGKQGNIVRSDLRKLAFDSGKGFELNFFPCLRKEMEQQLVKAPNVICFTGLRSCVKQLVGARRWSGRCQTLNDQIVDYLRECLTREPHGDCALVVQ